MSSAMSRQVAPEVVSPPPGNPRFPLLDSIRGLAVVFIVVFHTTFLSREANGTWGHIGLQLNIAVPIFFGLSAFLLYRPFIADRVGGRRPGIGGYAWRRALRILPAYWLVIAVAAFYNGNQSDVFGSDWWVYFGLLGNYAPLYDPQALCGGPAGICSGIYWSLGTEVLFYALLPLYVFAMDWIAGRSGGGRWLPINLTVALGLGLGSIAVAVGALGHTDAQWVTFTLAATAIYFSMGLVLALLSVETDAGRFPALRDRLERHSNLLWAGAGLIFAIFCVFLPVADRATSRASLAAYIALAALFVLLLLTPAVFSGRGDGVPQRLLASRVLAWLGLVSYAMYLWHPIVANFFLDKLQINDHIPGDHFIVLTIPVLLGSVAIGAASYYLLEKPILRFKFRPPSL